MRPRRALAGVFVLFVAAVNVYFLFRSRALDSIVDVQKPEAVGEGRHAQLQNSWSDPDEELYVVEPVAPAEGDGKGRVGGSPPVEPVQDAKTGAAGAAAAVAEAKAAQAKAAASNEASDEASSTSSAPSAADTKPVRRFEYNYGQQPKNYKKGLRQIKRVLSKIASVAPGVEGFKPDTDYFRDIKSDTPLQEMGELPATSMILGMYLQLSDEEVETLKQSHSRMMQFLPTKTPLGAFGGRGVVMTGGGKYFPMVLTAIRWLRETDPEIPVEVFMEDSSEYEKKYCDGLFPKINVECRVVQDIYGAALSAKLNSKYALKPLAILASKFDDIYFMDADSYPLTSVDDLFDWSVYKETGYLLNADYWPRYISPRFYDVVGRELGGRARGDPSDHALLQSDRENAVPGQSTESGQIYVRKSQHIRSLLLAMYYNLYGDVYFPLLMQNGHGEGDKDTYAAAAVICDEPYYQTQQRPVTLGHHRHDGSYHGFAMVQPNPRIDYQKFELGKDMETQMFALHANSIKSNIKYLMMDHDDPIRGAPRLRQHRVFSNMENVRNEMRSSEDVEQRLFRVMRDVACEWVVNMGYVPRDWEDQDPKRLCRVLSAHTQWLRENPDVAAPEDAQYWYDLDRRGRIKM